VGQRLNIGLQGDEHSFVAEIFGSSDELFQLGLSLRNQDKVELTVEPLKESAYKRGLKGLSFSTECFEPDYIHLAIESDVLTMRGSQCVRSKLGKSLTNCFEGPTPIGYHIHVDHMDGSGLVASLGKELIFTVA